MKKFWNELCELAHDEKTRLGLLISTATSLISLVLKFQGNPDALYVVLYLFLFVFIVFISIHILGAKNTVPGVETPSNPKPPDRKVDKYPRLKIPAVFILVLTLGATSVLLFLSPYNAVSKRFIYGSPTPTPSQTSTPTHTPTRTPSQQSPRWRLRQIRFITCLFSTLPPK